MVPKLRAAPLKRKSPCKKNKVWEYQKLAGIGRALRLLDNSLTLFLQWPVNSKQKRIPRLPSKNPGFILLKNHETCCTESYPEELVEEILSRLPVKSLARFTCVCKSWYHLISSDRLATLHLSNYKTSHPLVDTDEFVSGQFKLTFLPTPPQYFTAFQKVVKIVAPKALNDGTPRVWQKIVSPIVGGSCNGIICLYKLYVGSVVLWNPATKDFKSIPNSDIRLPDGVDPSYVTVMFGFDPNINDYKILQMISAGPFEIIRLRLYSLRKNSWRKIDSHDFAFHLRYSTSDLVCNLPWTNYRVICALTKPLRSSSPTKLEILRFDLSTEMFDMIEICPSLETQLHSGHNNNRFNKFPKLFPFNQSLAIAHNSYHTPHRQITHLWVLNDMYPGTSNKSSRSWSKLFSIEVDTGFRLIGSCDNHIIFQVIDTQRVGRFDPGKQKVIDYVYLTCGRSTSTFYEESLIRVSEKNETDIIGEQDVAISDLNDDHVIKKGKKRTRKQGVHSTWSSSSWQFCKLL